MNALLRALGVMLWGLAATGLLVAMVLLGQKAITMLRQPSAVAESPQAPPPLALPLVELAPEQPSVVNTGEPDASPRTVTAARANPNSSVRAPDAWLPPAMAVGGEGVQAELHNAVVRHDNAATVLYATQLAREGKARPQDLALLAIALYVLGDCSPWIAKAIEAYERQGAQVSPALARARDRCADKHSEYPFRTARGGAAPGDADVKVGELYYGFDDYPRAIAALERGLLKGGVRGADVAYVYLGLAHLALKQYPEACSAFDQLEYVAGTSPRVHKLWATFADTHCMIVESDP